MIPYAQVEKKLGLDPENPADISARRPWKFEDQREGYSYDPVKKEWVIHK
jgi:hypothetical protein